MSKAKERALEKYPKKIEWVGNQWDGAPFDVNSKSRVAYKQGYEQAEKDLELTWEDMMVIHKCIKDAMNYHLYKMLEGAEGQKIVYQEVLKRFKERKENAKVNV